MAKMNLKNLTALVLSLLLVTNFVLTGCAGTETVAPPETPSQIIKDIAPQEAVSLIQNNQNNPDFVILDVRTPEEVAEEYIKDAINIDYYSESFRDELDRLDKNQTYLIYCRSGARSGNARDIMAELNFREVYNILGGFIRWQAEGLESAS